MGHGRLCRLCLTSYTNSSWHALYTCKSQSILAGSMLTTMADTQSTWISPHMLSDGKLRTCKAICAGKVGHQTFTWRTTSNITTAAVQLACLESLNFLQSSHRHLSKGYGRFQAVHMQQAACPLPYSLDSVSARHLPSQLQQTKHVCANARAFVPAAGPAVKALQVLGKNYALTLVNSSIIEIQIARPSNVLSVLSRFQRSGAGLPHPRETSGG